MDRKSKLFDSGILILSTRKKKLTIYKYLQLFLIFQIPVEELMFQVITTSFERRSDGSLSVLINCPFPNCDKNIRDTKVITTQRKRLNLKQVDTDGVFQLFAIIYQINTSEFPKLKRIAPMTPDDQPHDQPDENAHPDGQGQSEVIIRDNASENCDTEHHDDSNTQEHVQRIDHSQSVKNKTVPETEKRTNKRKNNVYFEPYLQSNKQKRIG